jgi:hypothetical protein
MLGIELGLPLAGAGEMVDDQGRHILEYGRTSRPRSKFFSRWRELLAIITGVTLSVAGIIGYERVTAMRLEAFRRTPYPVALKEAPPFLTESLAVELASAAMGARKMPTPVAHGLLPGQKPTIAPDGSRDGSLLRLGPNKGCINFVGETPESGPGRYMIYTVEVEINGTTATCRVNPTPQ